MQTIQQQGIVAQGSNYRNYQGGYFQVLISPEQTQGSMALIDITLPKGVEPPVHLHTREDETFYVIEGEMTFHVGDEIIHALPGQAVFGPRGVAHHFEINSESARFLTLLTPGKFMDYFLEFSFPATGQVQVVPPQGPPPAEVITYMTSQLTEKFGILFI